MLKQLLGCLVVVVGLAASPASATVMFLVGNHPQPDEANILFGGKETGTTITGEVDHTGVDAIFSSLTGQTLLQNAKGQADITNNAGKKDDLTSMHFMLEAGFGFTDFIMNLENGHGNATVLVTSGGETFTYTLGKGQNYLTIVATGGEVMTAISVTMDTGGGFLDFKQPRISGACEFSATGGDCTPIKEVPEPQALSLLGIALLALTGIRRRRK